MVCSACGCEQSAGAQFCRQCGSSLTPAPTNTAHQASQPRPGAPPFQPAYSGYATAKMMEQRQRVRQHQQPLGIIWIMYGVYRIATGLIGAFVLHNLVSHGMFSDAPPFLPHLLGSVVPTIVTLSAFMGVVSIVAGYGLLSRQPWARVVTLVLSVLALIKIPFGTALGIYTLWVLAPVPARDEWQAVSVQA